MLFIFFDELKQRYNPKYEIIFKDGSFKMKIINDTFGFSSLRGVSQINCGVFEITGNIHDKK